MVMKYYIEKDSENRVIAKGITVDTAELTDEQIEVTKAEFDLIEQYEPLTEPTIHEPTLEERISAVEMALLEVL